MKIIHVLPALTKGGGERVAVDLANWQAAAGYHVTIIAGFAVDPALLQNHVADTVAIRFVSSGDASLRRAYTAAPSWIMMNRSRLNSADIIHCHLSFASVFGTLCRLLLGGQRPAIVETYHAVGMATPNHHRWLHARLLSQRDAIALMARDSWWDGFLAAHPKLPQRIIENGIDTRSAIKTDIVTQKHLRQKWGVAEESLLIGTVGQLRDDREPWNFIPVFRHIADQLGDAVEFIIAGEGPARARTEAAIAEHGLTGRVHLPGQVDSAAAVASTIDVYVTLAVGRVVGLAALEAVLAGAPVIARQMDASHKMRPDEWVWSNAVSETLADHAIHLLEAPAERKKLAAKQREIVENKFGVETMAKAYEELYTAAISLRSPEQ
jgi:glycosyltransferase involved in cell wall biosynthesis